MQAIKGDSRGKRVEPPATIREYMAPGDGLADASITEVELPPNSAMTDHRHDTDQIVYVLDGEARFVGPGGEQHDLRLGDVIFIPAGALHRHECAGAEPLRQLAIFVPPRE